MWQQRPEDLSHSVLGFQRMPEGEVGMDLVVATATEPVLREVAGFHQIADDAVGGAFGDSDALGDVAQARVGLPGDTEQDVSVVGKELPSGHA